MKTLRFVHKPCSVLCLCAVFVVSANLLEASFVSNVGGNRGAVSSISSRPLRVVDCVLEKCVMLASAPARDLCSYLLCMPGSNGPARRPGPRSYRATRHRDLAGQTSASGDLDRTSDDHYVDDRDQLRLQRQREEEKWTVNKRWQYPDPLQHCIQTYCQEHHGVGFYTCVYKNCISALLNTQFPNPV